MRIPRLARFLVVGLLIGIWFSAFVHAAEAVDPGGDIPGEHIHGISVIMLGFFSLPWSIPVWVIGAIVSDASMPSLFYWSMPPVAGMGWGWLVSVILAKVRSERTRESPNSVAAPVESESSRQKDR